MKAFRCKCGKKTLTSSMGPGQDCEGCDECQTTFADNPDHHVPLIPHDWEDRVQGPVDNPRRFEVCKRCHSVKPQLAKPGVFIADFDPAASEPPKSIGRVVQTVEGQLSYVRKLGSREFERYEAVFFGDDGERLIQHSVVVPEKVFELLKPHADTGERIRLTLDCLDAEVEVVGEGKSPISEELKAKQSAYIKWGESSYPDGINFKPASAYVAALENTITSLMSDKLPE